MNRILLSLILVGLTAVASAAARDQIVIPDRATAVEKTAANELKAALARITGEKYEVVSESDAASCRFK